jgi:hypothetical protein
MIESICAQVECNRVSNAPSSVSKSASLRCHTGALDMTQFYDGAPTILGTSAQAQPEK